MLFRSSGTGKSVLIKIVCGLLTQDAGSVIVLGEDVKSLNTKKLEALRLKVGFSFQLSALYDSMTDAQKKTADTVFRDRVMAAAKRNS